MRQFLALLFFISFGLQSEAWAENGMNRSVGIMGLGTLAHLDDARLPGAGVGIVANNDVFWWGKVFASYNQNGIRSLAAVCGTRIYWPFRWLTGNNNLYFGGYGGLIHIFDKRSKDKRGGIAQADIGYTFLRLRGLDSQAEYAFEIGATAQIVPDSREEEWGGDYDGSIFLTVRRVFNLGPQPVRPMLQPPKVWEPW